MPRKPKEKVDIDVVPYLSIMVIVLKLICLILIVTVMRIALNPHGVKAVAIQNLYGVERADNKHLIRAATYFDCSPDGVMIFPEESKVPSSSLNEPGNAVERAIKRIAKDSKNEYAIVLVRPRAVREYRLIRKMLDAAKIDVGYDVFDADVKVDYKAAAHAIGIEDKDMPKE